MLDKGPCPIISHTAFIYLWLIDKKTRKVIEMYYAMAYHVYHERPSSLYPLLEHLPCKTMLGLLYRWNGDEADVTTLNVKVQMTLA